MRLIDIEGEKFGKITVIEKSHKRSTNGQIFWKCVCECGNKNEVVGFALRYGRAKSCGKCPREPYNKNPDRQKVIWNKLYTYLKQRSKRYGKIDINYEKFKEISILPCTYCGLDYSNLAKDNAKGNRFHSDIIVRFNGLDRIDSTKGYTNDNVVPCCKYCNVAKNDLTTKEYRDFIKRAYDYLW